MKLSRRKEYALILIAILFILLVLIYYGNLKEGFHMDELYSYGLSNSNYSAFPFANRQWLSADYYQSYLTASPETNFDYGSVIYNQTRDVHPPVYYILLHTISSFLPNIFSKWIGLFLNMIFYILTAILVYKIINYFTANKYVGLIGMLFYGLSIGAISNYLFIRMYVMQTFLQVLLIYFTIKYIKSDKYNWYTIFSLSITIIIGGLTQYYFYIFAFFVTAITTIIFFITRNYKKMIVYPLQSAISVILAFLIFPSVFDHVTSTSRGTEVLENAEGSFSLRKLNNFINYLSKDLFNDYLNVILFGLIILALISLIVIIYRKRNMESNYKVYFENNKVKSAIVILISTVLYLIVVSQVSHYQVSRYIYSIYPFMSIMIILFVYYLSNIILQSKTKSTSILILFSIIITGSSHYNRKPDYLFEGMQENHQKIEEVKNNDALVLSDSAWRTSSQINELRKFNGVYPGIISEENNLPMDDRFEELETLIIFIYEELDSDELHQEINNTYNLNHKNYLYEVSGFNVYSFSDS